MTKKLILDDIILVGRRFQEYNLMFNLSELNLGKERILDVAAGVSSFGMEANKMGYNVTSIDKIYSFSHNDLKDKCKTDLEIICKKLEPVKDKYLWNFFKNTEELREYRTKAYLLFLKDFQKNEYGKYVSSTLPKTNFKDKTFTVSLVSHLLFIYDDLLDYEFHRQTIIELIRITSKEIRIYPLINFEYKKSTFIEKIHNDKELKAKNIRLEKTHYEFVKDGNEMLVIKL